MPHPARDEFLALVESHRARDAASTLAVPLSLRLLADQLTPVLGYRRLVAGDPRDAPSFLFESVEGGDRQGRHSIMGAQPSLEVLARGHDLTIARHRPIGVTVQPGTAREADPLLVLRRISSGIRLVKPEEAALPNCFLGGWAGFAGYDTVRYAEPDKLKHPARDDRALPDLHFAFYDGVVIFDHVDRLVTVVTLALVSPSDDAARVYDDTRARLLQRAANLQRHSKPLPSGVVRRSRPAPPSLPSNITRDQHGAMVARAKEYIAAGDVFQVVLGQRFERRSAADPFDAYRALRTVNPSPYMGYVQASGCILIASSPEILCRVANPRHGEQGFVVTNRPLAGTRRRGQTPDEDAGLEQELLADPKERAEHIMLVDLGRNDVGRVAVPGSIRTPRLLEVERYSHVMHISSTITGTLRPDLDCWDALRAALPAGTISGAPKVRAMQIIDELEPVRRGPYGGGFGYVGLDGQMDVALTLRTMIVPTGQQHPPWTYHLQASGGIVADSDAAAEFQETVNKAAALARAIDLVEDAFSSGISTSPTADADRQPSVGGSSSYQEG